MKTNYFTRIFTLCSVAFTCTCIFTVNGQWLAKSSIPGANSIRDGSVSWVIGTKAYVVGGNGHNDLLQYDPATNSWTSLAPIPQGITLLGMGFVINGKGYLCGGEDQSGSPLNSLLEYDPLTNVWTTKAPFPGGNVADAIGFSIGSKGYICCGDDGIVVYDWLYEYDPSANSWTPKAAFPGGPRTWPYGFSIGNKGYVGGGSDQTSDQNDLWEYDPLSDAWVSKSALPGVGRESAVSFASSTSGYVGLGQTNYTTCYSDMYKYNATNDSWSSLPAFIGARAWATGFAYGSDIYVGTGWDFTTFFHDLYSLPIISGAEEIQGESAYNLYPNPASEFICLRSGRNDISLMQIVNTSGQVVMTKSIDNKTGNILLSGLPAGVYFVQVTLTNGKCQRNKLVLIK